MEDLLKLLRSNKNPRYLCFPTATLMDRMAYNKDGGIFAGFFSDDWMRAQSYKLANVQELHKESQILTLGVLERRADRRWENLNRYLAHIKSFYGSVSINLFLNGRKWRLE
jgi:hypothetical protein